MPSTLKSETARANGAKSRGPKSAATREKSSLNAVRHGFTAHNTILLQCEDPDLFQELQADFKNVFGPATPEEEVLVDQMTVQQWRMQRLWTIETALYDTEARRQDAAAAEDSPQPNAAARLSQSFRAMADESRALALLSRYDSRLQRSYDRCYRTLRQIQQIRRTAAQPEPPTPAPLPDPKGPSSDDRVSGSTPALVNREAHGPSLVPAPQARLQKFESNPPAIADRVFPMPLAARTQDGIQVRSAATPWLQLRNWAIVTPPMVPTAIAPAA